LKFNETSLKGAYVIEVDKIEDNRGFFGRLWCEKEFKEYNLKTNLVQSNVSFSKYKGTLRGMHFQKSPFEETKLVRCTQGSMYDVIIDLRPESPTFTKWFGIELSAKNRKMLYVPENFAHGFVTLEDNSEVYYMVTEFYNDNAEGGIRWNDPSFKIHWPQEVKLISKKDSNHPNFNTKIIL
jgi:dTDP-4-dehydrorhamnose 3,5-epimerase